ncbi:MULTISPECIES: DUF6713 family protein [Paenibacillus]|uniref:DUF6713 family protein n=1 Tax=Paenibacillus TaxID=44249 RepID=UPI0011A16E65|nr:MULTISPECIES: DUF6713 family protein [Paenibacillus]MBU5354633.1 hypothetical protein [Paenibacillus barcinonensis]MCK6077482.1 hypothetical protein [Paenibacillus silvae]MCK6151786.1 hypothetical protein [Paenibacillus silvae]MCK6270272.1 hypothetical protein [Paenibacillus silvae]MDM5279808.1 hypothetical protein [Paenibacillus silvae]
MPSWLLILFLFNLSLFLLHEMDAIRRSEWKLFIVFKDMKQEQAYTCFTWIHLPLYTIILSLLFSSYQTITFWVLDIFFIIHTVLHFFFEKHPRNEFKNRFSRSLIYPMGLIALIHLICLMLM